MSLHDLRYENPGFVQRSRRIASDVADALTFDTAKTAVEDVLKYEERSLEGYEQSGIIRVFSRVAPAYQLVKFVNKDTDTLLVVNLDMATGEMCEFSEALVGDGYYEGTTAGIYKGGSKFVIKALN